MCSVGVFAIDAAGASKELRPFDVLMVQGAMQQFGTFIERRLFACYSLRVLMDVT